MNGAILKSVLLLAVSALLVVGVVYFVGFEETLDAVRQSGPLAFGAAGVLSLVLLFLQARAWSVLNRPIRHDIPFRTLFEAVTAGLAANIMTPSSYLGGEPVKVAYAGRKTGLPYHELAGTVVLAKYLEALSFILFFAFSAIVAAISFREVLFSPVNLPVGIALLALAAVLLVVCLVLWLSLSRGWSPLTRLVGFLGRLGVGREFFGHLRERTLEMEGQVTRVFREEGKAAFRAFILFALTHIVIFLKPAVFFFLGAGESRILLGLGKLSLIFVACQALLAFQLTPSGAGTLDAGLLGTFALVGLADRQCMALLLCIRFWDLVVVGAGALLAARVGAGLLAGEPAPEPASNPAEGKGRDDAA